MYPRLQCSSLVARSTHHTSPGLLNRRQNQRTFHAAHLCASPVHLATKPAMMRGDVCALLHFPWLSQLSCIVPYLVLHSLGAYPPVSNDHQPDGPTTTVT
eukprot:GGOE01031742.1.p2 GENE.GGOE01031742.1~~GGOE01031742.1.p2  ORF type:complete len:100 (+),score=2.89 GGOE01031742.1:219-518(+)